MNSITFLTLIAAILLAVDGLKYEGSRVVGGEMENYLHHPYFGVILKRGHWYDGYFMRVFCGASLISPHFFLTAAHCLRDHDPRIYSVAMGFRNRCVLHPFKGRYSVKYVITHPSYRPRDNDIGLIRTKYPVLNYAPIRLPLRSIFTGQRGKVIGYGLIRPLINNKRYAPCHLHSAVEEIRSKRICRENAIMGGYTPQKHVFCSSGIWSVQSTACFGDSGGPFVTYDVIGNETYPFIQGVVSTGDQYCDSTNQLNHMTNVYIYVDWIEEVILNDTL